MKSATDGRSPRCVASYGVAALSAESWPLAEAAAARTEIILQDEQLSSLGALPGGPWPEPVRAVAVLPINGTGLANLGFLVGQSASSAYVRCLNIGDLQGERVAATMQPLGQKPGWLCDETPLRCGQCSVAPHSYVSQRGFGRAPFTKKCQGRVESRGRERQWS